MDKITIQIGCKQYTLKVLKDDSWVVGQLVEKPGVMSQGRTLDELIENIKDAYQLIVEVCGEQSDLNS